MILRLIIPFLIFLAGCDLFKSDTASMQEYSFTQSISNNIKLDSVQFIITINETQQPIKTYYSNIIQPNPPHIIFNTSTGVNSILFSFEVNEDDNISVQHTSYSKGYVIVKGGKAFIAGQADVTTDDPTVIVSPLKKFISDNSSEPTLTYDLFRQYIIDSLSYNPTSESQSIYSMLTTQHEFSSHLSEIETSSIINQILDTFFLKPVTVQSYNNYIKVLSPMNFDSIYLSRFYESKYDFNNPLFSGRLIKPDPNTLVLKASKELKRQQSSQTPFASLTISGDSLYVARLEVTHADFWGKLDPTRLDVSLAQYPVSNITFIEAIQYCNLLTVTDTQTLRSPAYIYSSVEEVDGKKIFLQADGITQGLIIDTAANGYRLPTQLEWEAAYAYNLPYEDVYYFWGDSLSTQNLSFAHSSGIIQPGGILNPNLAGLYDIASNVAEMTHATESNITLSTVIRAKGGSSADINQHDIKSYLDVEMNKRYPYIGLRIVYSP
ncbi:MAG: formylglycine-generating enzyme family protein [Fibrobacterales bacterium]